MDNTKLSGNETAPAAALEETRESEGPASECFEIRDEGIDVAEIMSRIDRAVADKRARGVYRDESWLKKTLNFNGSAAGASTMDERLDLLRAAASIDVEGDPIASHRRFAGGLIVWFKRWTRFWIRRYTDGIFYKQNHFNTEVINLLTSLASEVRELRQKVAELENKGRGDSNGQ